MSREGAGLKVESELFGDVRIGYHRFKFFEIEFAISILVRFHHRYNHQSASVQLVIQHTALPKR